MNKERYEACLEQIKLFMKQEDITVITLLNGELKINHCRKRDKNILSQMGVVKEFHTSLDIARCLFSDMRVAGRTVACGQNECVYRHDAEIWMNERRKIPEGFVTIDEVVKLLNVPVRSTRNILYTQKEIDRTRVPIGKGSVPRIVYRVADVIAFHRYCQQHGFGMTTSVCRHFKTENMERISSKKMSIKYHINLSELVAILRRLEEQQLAHECDRSDACKNGGGWLVNRDALTQAIREHRGANFVERDEVPFGWLSREECAELFNVSSNHLTKLISRYGISYKSAHATGIGQPRRFYDPQEVEKMLRHHIATASRVSIKPTFPTRLPTGTEAKSYVY